MRTISARTAAYSASARSSTAAAVVVRVAERVAQLGREQRLAQRCGPARARDDLLGQVSADRLERFRRPRPRRRRRRGQERGRVGVVAGGGLRAGDRVPSRVRRRRRSAWRRHRRGASRPARVGCVPMTAARLAEEPRDRPRAAPATDASRDGERREVAGEQRVQPAADEVDPEQRAPRLLAELRLGEAERVELAADEVEVDPLVRGQRRADRARRAPPPSDRRTRAARRGRPRSCPTSGRRGGGRRRRWRPRAGARTARRGRWRRRTSKAGTEDLRSGVLRV